MQHFIVITSAHEALRGGFQCFGYQSFLESYTQWFYYVPLIFLDLSFLEQAIVSGARG